MAKRWRKNPAPTGIGKVSSRVRGSKLYDGEQSLASVSYSDGQCNSKGWYWYCPSNESLGIEHRNTCGHEVEIKA